MNKASGLLVALEGVFRDLENQGFLKSLVTASCQCHFCLHSKFTSNYHQSESRRSKNECICEQGHSYILTRGSSGWSYACSGITVVLGIQNIYVHFWITRCRRADPAGDMLELRDAILHPPPLHPSSVFRQSSTSSIIVYLPESKTWTFHVVSFDVYVLFYFYDVYPFLLFAALVSAHHYTQRIRWTY